MEEHLAPLRLNEYPRTPFTAATRRRRSSPTTAPGIADAQTLDYVARLLGDEEVRQVSSTSGAEGRHSKTESVAYRSLAPANVLREMRPGRGLLVYGHLAPARITLRPWFEDRRLRRLAAGALP